jgi:hypothetical protein
MRRCVGRFAAGSKDYYTALALDRTIGVGLFVSGLESGG